MFLKKENQNENVDTKNNLHGDRMAGGDGVFRRAAIIEPALFLLARHGKK